MSGIDLAIDNLKTQVADLKQQFSQARKKGFDVSLPYLKFMNLPSKVGVAEATKNTEDIKRVILLLDEIRKELEETQKQGEMSTKNHDEQGYMQRIESLFMEAEKAVREKHWERVLNMYVEIRGLYPFIPEGLKKETYKRSLELYHALQEQRKQKEDSR